MTKPLKLTLTDPHEVFNLPDVPSIQVLKGFVRFAWADDTEILIVPNRRIVSIEQGSV